MILRATWVRYGYGWRFPSTVFYLRRGAIPPTISMCQVKIKVIDGIDSRLAIVAFASLNGIVGPSQCP
eukprot:1161773-Pelagomonas_calceolata.AAC.29